MLSWVYVAAVQNAFKMLRKGQVQVDGVGAKLGARKAPLSGPFRFNTLPVAAPITEVARGAAELAPALAQRLDRRLQGAGPMTGQPWWRALKDFVPVALLKVCRNLAHTGVLVWIFLGCWMMVGLLFCVDGTCQRHHDHCSLDRRYSRESAISQLGDML
jgi:hypothetical protein